MADIDRDGDLDIIIAQAGRGEFGVTPVGYANHILVNTAVGANFASRSILSVRDPGGPLLTGATPSALAQGQIGVITLTGKNFAGSPTIDLGPGLTIVEQYPVKAGGSAIALKVQAALNAPIGPRQVRLTNPDTQYAVRSKLLSVVDKTQTVDSAVDNNWPIYE